MKNAGLYIILAAVVLYIFSSSYKKFQRTQKPRDLVSVIISMLILVAVAFMMINMWL